MSTNMTPMNRPVHEYQSDILFILKKREMVDPDPNSWTYRYGQEGSSGLLNSVKFINEMLRGLYYDSNMVQVFDNNCIDREVTKYRPKVVVIEALWVVPEKFEILTKLHPDVEWIIRLHSEVPFLSVEGIAMEWLFKYIAHPRVHIGANSRRVVRDVAALLDLPVHYMPNYYPVSSDNTSRPIPRDVINISCFGAIRPLKNHLAQAIAAIHLADVCERQLRFHINATRMEGRGEPILKNIRALFANSTHELVEHPWMSHEEFINLIKTEIDIGMQVSFTETFNIVAADHVSNNVPIVASNEVAFVSGLFVANPTSTTDMVCALRMAWLLKGWGTKRNKRKLNVVAEQARLAWDILLTTLA